MQSVLVVVVHDRQKCRPGYGKALYNRGLVCMKLSLNDQALKVWIYFVDGGQNYC